MAQHVRILSYNLWQLDIPDPLPWVKLGGEKIPERLKAQAQLIGAMLASDAFDAIAVSEAFKYDEFLAACSEHCSAFQHTRPLPADLLAGKVMNGGVLILTPHEIRDQNFIVFEDGLGPDAHGSKGVSYARIRVANGFEFFVFATHLQSDEATGDTRRVRQVQMERMCEFVARTVTSAPGSHPYPVILAGDFNVDSLSDQYEDMKRILYAEHGPLSGCPFTVDYQRNDWKKGKRPQGMEADGEYLDYVLVSRFPQFSKPINIGSHECVRFRGQLEGIGERDLSDHYAVQSDFTFDVGSDEMERRFVDIVIGHNLAHGVTSGERDKEDDVYFAVREGTATNRVPPEDEWRVHEKVSDEIKDKVLWSGLNDRARL